MAHSAKENIMKWKFYIVDPIENHFVIECCSKKDNQKGWKIHIEVDEGNQVVLSKFNCSHFKLIPDKNGKYYQICHVETGLTLTLDSDSPRDELSNFIKAAKPGSCKDMWNLTVRLLIYTNKLLIIIVYNKFCFIQV